LKSPFGLWVSSVGDIFIADDDDELIRRVDRSTGIISTLFYTTGSELKSLQGIWGDSIGNLFIPDSGNHKIQILNIASKTLFTIAGTGTSSSTGDGGSPSLATFIWPTSIWGDSKGLFLFIADGDARRVRIIDKSLDIIYTIAGTGTASPSGPDGLAVSTNIDYPYSVWGNTAETIFITEYYGNKVRKLYPLPSFLASAVLSYMVATVTTTINTPVGVWQDSIGTLYIAENSRHRVLAVSSLGIISTVAGTGTKSSSATNPNGDNGPVSL
jgi:hypothetical protein